MHISTVSRAQLNLGGFCFTRNEAFSYEGRVPYYFHSSKPQSMGFVLALTIFSASSLAVPSYPSFKVSLRTKIAIKAGALHTRLLRRAIGLPAEDLPKLFDPQNEYFVFKDERGHLLGRRWQGKIETQGDEVFVEMDGAYTLAMTPQGKFFAVPALRRYDRSYTKSLAALFTVNAVGGKIQWLSMSFLEKQYVLDFSIMLKSLIQNLKALGFNDGDFSVPGYIMMSNSASGDTVRYELDEFPGVDFGALRSAFFSRCERRLDAATGAAYKQLREGLARMWDVSPMTINFAYREPAEMTVIPGDDEEAVRLSEFLSSHP